MRIPQASGYRRVIDTALEVLLRKGEIISYNFKKKRSNEEHSLFYYVIMPSGKTILFKFLVTLNQKTPAQSSSGYSEFFLPTISGEELKVSHILEFIRVEIRRRVRGSEHEALVLTALKALKEEGVIGDAWKTRKAVDIKGRDVMIRFFGNDGVSEEVGIQIKSSVRGQEKHRARHPEIPSVVVAPKDTLRERLKTLVLSLKNRTEALHV